MKIVIKTLDNSRETVLADGFSRGNGIFCGPSDFKITDTAENQVEPFVRASSQAVFDRLNQKFVITFGSIIKFATLPEALTWQINFHIDRVRFGNLLMIETGSAGQQYRTQLSRAHVYMAESIPIGLSRKISFAIVGENLNRL